MTELYILDSAFNVIGVVDEFISLIWTRRYYDCGSYELYLPAERFELLEQGEYLYRAETQEAALIERRAFERDENGGGRAIASGRMLEALLARRTIPALTELSGNAETVLRTLVSDNAITPEARRIDALELGDESGVGGEVSVQLLGENLLEAIYSICAEQELSARISLDYLTNRLRFIVWQGLDRTMSQTANSWAIFSDDFENISSSGYERDETDWFNFAYVHGVADDDSEVEVTVDNRGEGEALRELYVDAKGVKQKVDGAVMSLDDFKALLRQEGLEALAEYAPVDAVDGCIGGGGSLVYGQDFGLGDLCEYVDHEVGIAAQGRITEVTETFENNAVTVEAVLGEGALNIMQKIKRREKVRK